MAHQERGPGRAIRDTIQAEAKQHHLEHDAWPGRRELARRVGIPIDNLRYHVDILVEAGIARRTEGGAVQILSRATEVAYPPVVVAIDALIVDAVTALVATSPDGVTLQQIREYIVRQQRALLSRRATALVASGVLVRQRGGYLLPDDQK